LKAGDMDYREGSSWKKILSQSITTPDALPTSIEIDRTLLQKVVARYPMRLNPYYLSLIKRER